MQLLSVAAALASLCACSCRASCLPEAFTQQQLQNISIGGVSQRVKVAYAEWASSHMLAEIAAILLREKMGFDAEVRHLGAGSSEALLSALADCATLDPHDCRPGPFGQQAHLGLEVWEYYASGARQALLAELPDRVPIYVGYPEGLGYYGADNVFVGGEVVKRARASQVSLQWYEAYNDSWSMAAQFYTSHLALPRPDINCSEVQLLNGEYLRGYLRATGDEGAARAEAGDGDGAVPHPSCTGEWMLSRTCRARVAAGRGCIPVVSRQGWGIEALLQLAYFYDMPLAFGAFTKEPWLRIPTTDVVLFYWWFPDTQFIDTDASEIQFPVTNIDEQSQGIFKTMASGMKTLKVAHAALPEAEPLIEKFMKNLRLSMQTVAAMIRPYNASIAAQQACEWLLGNRDVWDMRWVPDPTECFPGQGLKTDTATGRLTCSWCDPGTKSEKDANLTYRCVQCPAGRSQPSPGAQECQKCAAGMYASSNASTACVGCLVGSYQNDTGESSCRACGRGESTFERFVDIKGVAVWSQVRGAWNESMCGCDVGTRHDADTGECVACGVGIDCRGMSEIFIEPGYYAPGGELSVFRCFADARKCVGGPLGADMCNDGCTGLTCARCQAGRVEAGDGTCVVCGGAPWPLLVAVFLLVLFFLCALYKVVDGTDVADRRQLVALLLCEASMFSLFVQQLGVLGKMSVQFSDPFAGILKFASLFNFNFDLLQLNCLAPSMTPVSDYLVQIAAILSLVLAICALHLANVVVLHRGKFMERMFSLTGTLGTLFMIFLTSMVNAAVTPYECVSHPNGLETVRSFPTVVCWEDQHFQMISVSIPYFCIPVSFLVFIMVIVYQFPRAMSSGNVGFLQRYAMLFRRFTPGEYWYILFFVMRNTVFAMSPAFPGLLLQVLSTILLLTISYGILIRYRPWVAEYGNYIDIVIHVALIIFMSMIGFFAQDTDSSAAIGFTATLFTIAVLGAFVAGVVYIAYRKVAYRQGKEWKYFLCHHKGGTGAFSRLMKVQLLEATYGTQSKVWLDCDNLTNMEKLFGYVEDSDNVIALLSGELFCRPWCMGELVTAHIKNVPIIPLVFADFAPLTDEFIDTYAARVDISCLAPYGIALELTQDMMRHVRDRPQVVLPQHLTLGVMHEVVSTVEAKAFGRQLKDPVEKTPGGLRVVVVVDHANWESVATGLVLVKYVQRQTQDISMIPYLLRAEDAMPDASGLAACIFVLTNGAFSEPGFVKAMLGAVGARFLPVIAEDSFRFPGQAMLEKIRDTAPTKLRPYGVEASPAEVVNVIVNLFTEIAVVFAPQNYSSNEELLKTKAKAILARLSSGALRSLQNVSRVSHKTTDGGSGSQSADDSNGFTYKV